jgi:hypothetical protein
MKKLLIVGLSLGLALGASAQRGYYGGHVAGGGYHYYAAPRVSVGVGFGVYGPYAPFGPYYGFGFYSPYFGYPFGPYGYGYGAHPSKLSVKIQDIKSDYSDKIASARHDKSLSGHERRQTVRNLKTERDQKIEDLKSNYYKS